MASTILFAPQVESVQPAFVYDIENQQGKVKIYFSFSAYNKMEEISYVMFSLIDPNIISSFGSNSKLNSHIFPMSLGAIHKNNISYDNDRKKHYFELSLDNLEYFNRLSLNQFYQMQIYFIAENIQLNSETENGLYYSISQKFLTENKENISVASQAFLIRPIPPIKSLIINEIQPSVSLYELKTISGRIEYEDDSTIEGIASYSIDILDEEDTEVYSENFDNIQGVYFESSLKNCFLEPGDYKLYFNYKTINGYTSSIEPRSFQIENYENGTPWLTLEATLKQDFYAGAIEIMLKDSEKFNLDSSGKVIIQRSDELHNYTNWESLVEIEISSLELQETKVWSFKDYLIEAAVMYHYRFIYETDNEVQVSSTYLPLNGTEQEPYVIEGDFEDIFLSNDQLQLTIRYNPNIGSYKYVTQESLTNTLGGKYPIIRKNAQTKYRQFTLSGSFYFGSIPTLSFDSRGEVIDAIMNENNSYLCLGKELATEFYQYNDNYSKLANERKRILYEKRSRETVINFLTNGEIKLFRSPVEGNMIVYLSNVSFTPNKQLGRKVYDFSATVTEVCDLSYENLIKNNIATPADQNTFFTMTFKTDSNTFVENIVASYIDLIYLTPLKENSIILETNIKEV